LCAAIQPRDVNWQAELKTSQFATLFIFSASESEVPAEPHRQRDRGDFTGVMSAFFARGLPSGGSLRSIRWHPPFRDVIANDEG